MFIDDVHDPVIGEDDRHHLARVLRLRPGQIVTIASGEVGGSVGWWRRTEVPPEGLLNGGGRLIPIGEVQRIERHAMRTIGLALTKGDRLDWAVQKVTELGIDRIVLIAAEHSVVRWDDDRAPRHRERLTAVSRAASMQSRQVFRTEVIGPLSLADSLPVVGVPLDVAVADVSAASVLGSADGGGAVRGVLIGPEGGFSAAELAATAAYGAPRVLLPGGVLRAETAAVVAAALLVVSRCAI